MKPFFSSTDNLHAVAVEHARHETLPQAEVALPAARDAVLGRIAIYDTAAAAPRVDDVRSPSADSFIEELSARTYTAARDLGGRLPYTVIREVVENLVHARFKEPVVSILEGGDTVRFSDQGPGIPDKERALLPGYTTASAEMKDLIRGVGSGLPLVREFLAHEGGSLSLEDNLGTGTVVTLNILPSPKSAVPNPPPAAELDSGLVGALASLPRLSTRQKRVLSLVVEFGEAGPTLVSKELAVGLSTAYRDLAFLEELELITASEAGKRTTTSLGTAYLDSLFR